MSASATRAAEDLQFKLCRHTIKISNLDATVTVLSEELPFAKHATHGVTEGVRLGNDTNTLREISQRVPLQNHFHKKDRAAPVTLLSILNIHEQR